MPAINQLQTDDYVSYHGDCVEVVKELPDNSIDYGIHSPPFSNLYIYSDSVRDMGNADDDEQFLMHYSFLIQELHRVTVPGRLCSIHVKDLPLYKGRDGAAGLRDFPGRCIKAFEDAGWIYHSRVTIWKDPVIEMQRTKNHGLLYKQLCKDSSASRQGMADYLITFRKWPIDGGKPVTTGGERFDRYVGESGPDAPLLPTMSDEEKRQFSIQVWQRYASPVWMDIDQTNVLNYQQASDPNDEKHICPLQLDVIERAIELWTNPGDVVLSPFSGIGSEGYVAVKMGRKFVGTELKEGYWKTGLKHLAKAVRERAEVGNTLFAAAESGQ